MNKALIITKWCKQVVISILKRGPEETLKAYINLEVPKDTVRGFIEALSGENYWILDKINKTSTRENIHIKKYPENCSLWIVWIGISWLKSMVQGHVETKMG